jgi:hypothetical protein
MRDLALRGGRVIDPASGRDETTDIAFGDGKVTEIGEGLPASGAEIVDVRGLLVVPGLVERNGMAPRSPPRKVTSRQSVGLALVVDDLSWSAIARRCGGIHPKTARVWCVVAIRALAAA